MRPRSSHGIAIIKYAVLMIANAARVLVIVGALKTKSAQAKYSGCRTNPYSPLVMRGGL
jgi:hypothetical protein